MIRFFLIVTAIFFINSVFAQKTDWVFLKKDNKLLCEIKRLEFGKLLVSADEMSSIKIEWDAIDSLWSDKQFMIRLEDGTLIESSLDESWYTNHKSPLGIHY